MDRVAMSARLATAAAPIITCSIVSDERAERRTVATTHASDKLHLVTTRQIVLDGGGDVRHGRLGIQGRLLSNGQQRCHV